MKSTTLSIIIAVLIIVGALFVVFGGRNESQSFGTSENGAPSSSAHNVTIENGKQIVTINVKGGYNPQVSVASSSLPTVLRFVTNSTFDCSASVRIPSLSVYKILQNTASTDIDVGTPVAGTLQGMCGMGMYRFAVVFK